MAGSDERIDSEAAALLVRSGANGVLVPLPGTLPGISEDGARAMSKVARDSGVLTIGTIGTSEEGADVSTLRPLALSA